MSTVEPMAGSLYSRQMREMILNSMVMSRL
jgi:hypothetical protein